MGRRPQAGAPLRHPSTPPSSKKQYGNSPQQKLDCHEGELPTIRQASALRSRLPFPERLCAGSATFLADLAFISNDPIDSLDSESAIHPRQMRQERYWQNEDYPISRASPPGFSPR
jgi:hypothetical protein